jgi:hypothetical protein
MTPTRTAAAAARLARLDALAAAFARRPGALAFLALGSGAEPERLDAWSDLDFFAIVEPDQLDARLTSLDWIAEAAPIAWSFRNTPDGHKVLFDDGVLAEFAVFAPDVLASIPFSPGRVVWARADFDPARLAPTRRAPTDASDEVWLVGELLSNLLVGLGRFHRGERVAAHRLVQVDAVDRLLQLLDHRAEGGLGRPGRDGWNGARRVERRLALAPATLEQWMPGLAATPAAARAILDAVRGLAPVPSALEAAIRAAL